MAVAKEDMEVDDVTEQDDDDLWNIACAPVTDAVDDDFFMEIYNDIRELDGGILPNATECPAAIEEICAICLEEINPEDKLAISLNCNHKFDDRCMQKWLNGGEETCPVCRGYWIDVTSETC